MPKKAAGFCCLLLSLIMAVCSETAEAKLVMQTRGTASFAPYVSGVKKTDALYPGYRAEFLAHVDFYRDGRFVLTGIVGNMTVISRSDSSVFNLDRILYTLSPGFRYEFNRWIIRGSVHHESLYSISRSESMSGAYWQNSIRIGAGTKGSYYLFLRDQYRDVHNAFINSWDAQVNAGVFLRGSGSIWSAKNQNYRYEFFSLLRYHIGTFRKWAFFTGLTEHLWVKTDNATEQKIAVTVNFFRKGAFDFFGIYYTHTLYDTYTENNEDGLGALGLRIVF